MKALIAVFSLACLIVLLPGCAKQTAPSDSVAVAGPANSPYREWTTAQLQQRRSDLYYMISNGGQKPQKDEIRAIEGELIRRFRAGDKAANLQPANVSPNQPQH